MAQLVTPQPRRHPRPTAKANRLTHLIFERPDLRETERFLGDFGLVRVAHDSDLLLLRGSDPAPYCYRVHRAPRARYVGHGFAVESRSDLEALAAATGAGSIKPSELPGGGEHIALRDPSGFVVEVSHGQRHAAPLPRRSALPLNVDGRSPRVNAGQRLPIQPAQVVRLGHLVIEVADFQETCAWYTRHLGLVPSDVQVLPDGSPAVAFLRLDRADVPTDHHTLAIAQGFMASYGHSAYEVVDADAVGMGHRVLRERGWRHAWGIGRHVLGSQVFDYWHDAVGDKHEHYCDGDVFTADVEAAIHEVSREAMAQWGQPMPATFTRPSITLRRLYMLFCNLRRSPDVTARKLMTLARLFG